MLRFIKFQFSLNFNLQSDLKIVFSLSLDIISFPHILRRERESHSTVKILNYFVFSRENNFRRCIPARSIADLPMKKIKPLISEVRHFRAGLPHPASERSTLRSIKFEPRRCATGNAIVTWRLKRKCEQQRERDK